MLIIKLCNIYSNLVMFTLAPNFLDENSVEYPFLARIQPLERSESRILDNESLISSLESEKDNVSLSSKINDSIQTDSDWSTIQPILDDIRSNVDRDFAKIKEEFYSSSLCNDISRKSDLFAPRGDVSKCEVSGKSLSKSDVEFDCFIDLRDPKPARLHIDLTSIKNLNRQQARASSIPRTSLNIQSFHGRCHFEVSKSHYRHLEQSALTPDDFNVSNEHIENNICICPAFDEGKTHVLYCEKNDSSSDEMMIDEDSTFVAERSRSISDGKTGKLKSNKNSSNNGNSSRRKYSDLSKQPDDIKWNSAEINRIQVPSRSRGGRVIRNTKRYLEEEMIEDIIWTPSRIMRETDDQTDCISSVTALSSPCDDDARTIDHEDTNPNRVLLENRPKRKREKSSSRPGNYCSTSKSSEPLVSSLPASMSDASHSSVIIDESSDIKTLDIDMAPVSRRCIRKKLSFDNNEVIRCPHDLINCSTNNTVDNLDFIYKNCDNSEIKFCRVGSPFQAVVPVIDEMSKIGQSNTKSVVFEDNCLSSEDRLQWESDVQILSEYIESILMKPGKIVVVKNDRSKPKLSNYRKNARGVGCFLACIVDINCSKNMNDDTLQDTSSVANSDDSDNDENENENENEERKVNYITVYDGKKLVTVETRQCFPYHYSTLIEDLWELRKMKTTVSFEIRRYFFEIE